MHVDQDQVEERHQEQEQIHLQVHPAVDEARLDAVRILIDTVDLVSMPDT